MSFKTNLALILTDSNCERSVMVLTLTHEKDLTRDDIMDIVNKAQVAYADNEYEDDGSTEEDVVEQHLKDAGFEVEWPLSPYIVIDSE